MVLRDTVILADSSVEAAADTQDGAEQGARELIAHFNGQLDGLRGEQRPRQEAVTWNSKVTWVMARCCVQTPVT